MKLFPRLRPRLLHNNAMVNYSLKMGKPQGEYIGAPPGYKAVRDKLGRIALPLTFNKTTAGIPFVRQERV